MQTPLSSKGQLLIQILVGLVIAGMMSYAVGGMIASGLRGKRYLTGSFDLNQVSSDLLYVLSQNDLCKTALLNTGGTIAWFNPTATPASDLARVAVGTRTIAGVGMVGNDLQISGLTLAETDPTKRTTIVVGPTTYVRYVAELELSAVKVMGPSAGLPVKKRFLVSLLTNQAGHQVVECNLINSDGMLGRLLAMKEFIVGAATDVSLNSETTAPIGTFSYTPKGRFLKITSSGYMRISGQDTEGQTQMRIINSGASPSSTVLNWRLLFAQWGVTGIESTFGKLQDTTLVQVEPNQAHDFSFRLRAMHDFLSTDPPDPTILVRFHKEYPLSVFIEDWQ